MVNNNRWHLLSACYRQGSVVGPLRDLFIVLGISGDRWHYYHPHSVDGKAGAQRC